MNNIRHVLGISGGKDSAALAIYMKQKYPDLKIEFYNSDTMCELEETVQLVDKLDSYLGGIVRLVAAEGSPEPTPFDHFLKTSGGFLPSPQARWCTIKMKLMEFEKYVGDQPTISYVGIRGDENREGYVSTRPNIQTIFPFRKNIWSLDVTNKFLNNSSIELLNEIYTHICTDKRIVEVLRIVNTPITKQFFYSKKLYALLDLDVKLFNRAVFEFLKTTDYPIGKLDYFPLVDNDEVLVKKDIFRLLEDSGVGIPAYYRPIQFTVDGKVGEYNRSRSGCYFCFYQQKIEWVWLYEQHPDLYQKAMEYEKSGYTWIQSETLEDLIKPERVRQIKLDHIKRQENLKSKNKSSLLIDILDDDEINCANCFV